MSLDLQQYRHRTGAITVTAVQLTRDNVLTIWEWADSKPYYDPAETGAGLAVTGLSVYTREGRRKANFGDWVVRVDAGGEFYPVLDEAFQANYEPVAQ